MSTDQNPRIGTPFNPVRDPSLLTALEIQELRDFIVDNQLNDSQYLKGSVGGPSGRFVEMYVRDFTQHYAAIRVSQKPTSNKPKVRAKRMTMDTKVNKPLCPDHDVEMVFDPPTGVWTCPEFQCSQKMVRRETILDAQGRVLQSEIKLYSIGTGDDEKYYLYLPAYKIFIDVNEVMHRDGSGSLHGSGPVPKFNLSLLFNQLHSQADATNL